MPVSPEKRKHANVTTEMYFEELDENREDIDCWLELF